MAQNWFETTRSNSSRSSELSISDVLSSEPGTSRVRVNLATRMNVGNVVKVSQ